MFTQNAIGTGGRLFGEPTSSPDEVTFQVDNTSEAYFNSPYYTKHAQDLQPFDPPRDPAQMSLASVVGDDVVATITQSKKIAFHTVGDTGASSKTHISTEAHVADAMTVDLALLPVSPSFFFHLGDIVYYFGEGQYYYDQFYEPFRNYDRPIFSIAGNHDGMVFGTQQDTPTYQTLVPFMRNFCADTPGPSPDSGTLVRSTMNQPGVYFTLEAPFVTIIGLYTNVLEGPGVISSQNWQPGPVHYPISDEQLDFLTSELTRVRPSREALEQVVIVACHHPPISVDTQHGGWVGLSNDIDKACGDAGLWPDAVLSGHAHLYQRYTRTHDGLEIPYVVAGSGGHNAKPPKGGVVGITPVTQGEYTLVKEPVYDYGYMTVTIDMSAAGAETMTMTFDAPDAPLSRDEFVVDLRTRSIVQH
jgi:Calcineurin-like phosphoesterase